WGFPHGEGDFVTVVVPELFRAPSLVAAVLRRSTFLLKLRLLREPGIVVTDVPMVAAPDGQVPELRRVVGVVPVPNVNAASLRAVIYAQSLGLEDTKALFFSFEGDDADKIRDEWKRFGIEMPLEVSDAPYRDLGRPLLAHLRAITADPATVANVVMPELVVRGTDRLLHNPRALYLQRRLLL